MWWSILRFRKTRCPSPNNILFCLVILVLCGHLVTFGQIVPNSSSSSSSTTVSAIAKKKATIVRKAFKQLLKVKSLPSVNRNSKSNFMTTIPPQYMLELYEKYRQKERNSIRETNQRGNTVRSIVAVRGNINGDQMLVFNLSGIHAHEEMLRGELHFFKRRKIKWQRSSKAPPPEYRMKLFDITSENVAALATSEIPRHVHGWRVHDVTKMVKDCRTSSRWEHHLLGIKFEGLNKKLKFSSIPLKKFIKLNSLPFLIVFSNDPANNTINDLETHVSDKWYESEILTDDEDYDNFDYLEPIGNQVTVKQKKSFVPNVKQSGIAANVNKTAKGISTTTFLKRFSRAVRKNAIPEGDFKRDMKRNSRSLLNNELPDNSVYSNYIPQTSPGILQSRNRQQRQRQRNKPKTIPYPHRMTFGTNRNKGAKQEKKKQQDRHNRKLPKVWQQQQEYQHEIQYQPRHENDATADIVNEEDVRGNNICRKRKLVVDFADIGWGEWIISPKSFEAQYCSGSCPFPLTKNMKPSNHATIQSIVHAIGMQPNVPAPCCVADTMSSVTLLYFDEDRNVVLKNYPGMTVESCACH